MPIRQDQDISTNQRPIFQRCRSISGFLFSRSYRGYRHQDHLFMYRHHLSSRLNIPFQTQEFRGQRRLEMAEMRWHLIWH